MKAQILSDLHLEFFNDPVATVNWLCEEYGSDAPLLILAGDIIKISHPDFNTAMRVFCENYQYVIYVAGNHEYYDGDLVKCREKVAKFEHRNPNFFFLHNKVVDLEGLRFVGSTMWFPPDYHFGLARRLNDFHYIYRFGAKIRGEHNRAIKFLNREVTKDSIVITHHAPSEQSVSEEFKGDPFNCFYVCNMEQLMLDRQPRYWIHGHMHTAVDYFVDRTHVISNPIDYLPNWGMDSPKKFNRLVVDM